MAIFRSDVVLLATKVLKDELLALRDLLIELEGINFEQTDLKTQRTVNFWIFTVLLLDSQIIVGCFYDIVQD